MRSLSRSLRACLGIGFWRMPTTTTAWVPIASCTSCTMSAWSAEILSRIAGRMRLSSRIFRVMRHTIGHGGNPMKTLAAVVFLLLSATTFAADEPEVVYAKFHRAVMAGDLAEMLKYGPAQRRAEIQVLSDSSREAA